MLRSANQSRKTTQLLVLAAPLFASALWLLAPASTALASGPPARRCAVQRTSVRIVIGGHIGGGHGQRRYNDRCNDRCDDRCDGRHDDYFRNDSGHRRDSGGGYGRDYGRDYGRNEDLLYRGSSSSGGDRYYGLDSEAWCDLTSGRYLRAKHDFLHEIECRPCEPVPRIGYSIASGRLEHYREAEQSMRKAIDLDVDALAAICVDSDLRQEIHCLIEQYESQLRQCHTDPDVHFMIASLQSILGNYEAALCSIKDARRLGDCSPSARTLQCFIESKLDCHEGRGSYRGRH